MAFGAKWQKILGLFLITIILAVGGFYLVGVLLAPVYPSAIDDDLYYLARMKEAAEGYLNIGNPYYFEHRLDSAPAFTWPDLVSAWPLALGFSVTATALFNFGLWSLVFTGLLYLILRRLRFGQTGAVLGSLFIFLEVYWLVMRAVVLQTIWPVWLIFIFGLLLVEEGKRKKLGTVLLATGLALAFYFYSYLWQIELVVLLMAIIYHYYRAEKTLTKTLFLAGLGALVLALPALVSQWQQTQNPLYWETFSRLGLVKSHLPTIYAYNYGRWVLLVLVLWFMLDRVKIYLNAVALKLRQQENVLIYSLGFGLLIANWSNLVSGLELEIGKHVGRFITFYLALAGILIIRRFLVPGFWLALKNWWARLGLGLLAILLLLNLVSNLQRSLPWRQVIDHHNLSDTNKLAGVLTWLSTRPEKEQVVLADDRLAQYIPIYTSHYGLFAIHGLLQMMSDREVIDRYLVSRALQSKMTKEQLIQEFGTYAGAGELDRRDEYNWRSIWCHRYRADIFFGLACPSEKDLRAYEGEAYWSDLLTRWSVDKTNLISKLKFYHLRYLAWPKARLTEIDLENLPVHLVWQDANYVVYEFTSTN